jgi:hypothetical protein
VAADRARLEERSAGDRETSPPLEPSGTAKERKTSQVMEENCRRRDWESGKDLERSWSLGPKQDLQEALCLEIFYIIIYKQNVLQAR